MSKKILVAYASRYGSTQEVAETIATVLQNADYHTDIRPAKDVKTLEGWDAVVLGAAIYMFHWHKDAHRFLSRHRKALEYRPLAIFTLGPTDDIDEDGSRAQLDKDLAKYTWLKPKTIQVFGGKIDPERVNFPWKVFFKNVPPCDHRDWEAIDSWANKLPIILNV